MDLVLKYFKNLNDNFFDANGKSKAFFLKLKKNTQDDPFDEFITSQAFCPNGASIIAAGGPLINPDFIICGNQVPKNGICLDTNQIIGIESKSLAASRKVIDFNSTPPSELLRVYNKDGQLDIKAYYLISIICDGSSSYQKLVKGTCFVEGSFINEDFNLYLNAIGQRLKNLNLGSYGDGIDRLRPMFLFPNPITIDDFEQNCTLIDKRSDLCLADPNLEMTHRITRFGSGVSKHFYAYRHKISQKSYDSVKLINGPYINIKSKSITSIRGKFKF